MDQNYCTLYVVRHGQTYWNTKKLLQGHTDIPLNKTGEEQARIFGQTLKDTKFDAVFSSDLLRAKKTAEIMVLEKKLAVETTKLLRERRYGKFEGQKAESLEEFDRLKDTLEKEARLKYKPSPDVESDEELIGRVITFLREISVSFIGKNVLVVSHGGVMAALLRHLGRSLPHGAIENNAYIVLTSDGVDFFVKKTEGIKFDE